MAERIWQKEYPPEIPFEIEISSSGSITGCSRML